jgi:hypothetical protein
MNAPGIPESMDIKQLGNSRFTRKNAWYIANVPLNLIDYVNWEPSRYISNRTLIQSLGTVKPIMLGDIDKITGKYSLADGNHRCYCTAELGYTHIPAIIHISIKNDAFIKNNLVI